MSLEVDTWQADRAPNQGLDGSSTAGQRHKQPRLEPRN